MVKTFFFGIESDIIERNIEKRKSRNCLPGGAAIGPCVGGGAIYILDERENTRRGICHGTQRGTKSDCRWPRRREGKKMVTHKQNWLGALILLNESRSGDRSSRESRRQEKAQMDLVCSC